MRRMDMDKKEILEKSRAENKNKDLYAEDVSKTANSAVVLVMLVIAAVFFIVQLSVGGGLNFGIWALVFSADMTAHWVKYAKLRNSGDLLAAILYTVIVAVFAANHIYRLLTM